MKKYIRWTVIILGIMTFMSFGQENTEQSFLSKAIMANQYEIALAQKVVNAHRANPLRHMRRCWSMISDNIA